MGLLSIFKRKSDAADAAPDTREALDDVSAKDNACIAANNQAANSAWYYVVVKGTANVDRPGTYSMNNYSVRISAVSPTKPISCGTPVKDGGP